MTHDEILKRAAELLRNYVNTYPQVSEDESGGYCSEEDAEMDGVAMALDALREELARQEPVAKVHSDGYWTTAADGRAFSDRVQREATVNVYAAPQPAQVPDGWRLVPVEPTDDMCEAAWDSDAADYVGEHKRIHSASMAYKAMLSAAPQPKE